MTRSVGASPAARIVLGALASAMLYACGPKPPSDRVRVSGQVEATDVQVAAPVGGRLLDLAGRALRSAGSDKLACRAKSSARYLVHRFRNTVTYFGAVSASLPKIC